MDPSVSLQGCVSALSSSLSSLRSASENLDKGTHDFPRLATVLQTNRVFDVVAEQKVLEAKHCLIQEVEPHITNLIARIEAELARLAAREKKLKAEAELKELRIQNQEILLKDFENSSSTQCARPVTNEQLAELSELQAESERLAYSLSKKNLKQRKMRMSLAMGGH